MSCRRGGSTSTDAITWTNQIRWSGFIWVLVASRPEYREPWPLGLPWPLGQLRHGKGQGVPTHVPLVVPPRLPKDAPWLKPLGGPGGSFRTSRAPSHRVQGLGRHPCKEPFLPGTQIIRLPDPDHPDDTSRTTLLSRPQAGLNRMRLRTASKAPIVHLRTAPGHPAGVGRSRIEALETEPVGGRAPWAQRKDYGVQSAGFAMNHLYL